MATLSVEQVVISGLAPTQNSADAGGDDFLNNGNIILRVENGSGVSINVTITSPASVQGLAVEDPVIAVAAGAAKFIGPFPPSLFNDSTGKVAVDYSAATSVTVEVLEI